MTRNFSRPTRTLLTVGVVLGSILATLAVGEIAVRLGHVRTGDIEALRAATPYLPVLAGSSRSGRCYQSDALSPHPYFGYVFRSASECQEREDLRKVNNGGFVSEYDYPPERDPNYYSIMIVGGSVADQVAIFSRSDGGLQDVLNRLYRSPNGKPFRVINGAFGGWEVAQDHAVVSAYGDRVDAVAELDGYNERGSIDSPYSLEMPNPQNYLYSLHSTDDFRMRVALGALKTVVRAGRHWAGLWSLALYRLTASTLAGFAERQIADDGPGGRNHERLYRFFALPAEWNGDRRRDWNLRQFRKYLLLNQADSAAVGARYLQFLQPLPAIKKPLSEEERHIVQLVSAEGYQPIMRLTSDLRREGFPSVDLTDVFAGHTETLYVDHVHCTCANGTCPGYALMSARMAREMARAWRLASRERQ